MDLPIAKAIAFIAVLLVVPFSFAHLDDGEDVIVGNYLIDFGYSPANPDLTQATTLAFNLVDQRTQTPLTFDEAWLRISSSTETVFSGNLHPDGENVALSWKAPYEDNYKLTVRFIDNGETLVEHNFNLEVGRQKRGENLPFFIPILAAITIFAFVISKYMKR